MWKDRVEHAKDIWALYPGQTAHLTVRCMDALYRLQVMRGEAMSHLMALLEATKITLDNREELVVDLSTEMVEKDLQVEQLSNEIQELEELVWALYPGQTAHLTVRCMDALYRLQVMRGEAMSHLMALLEATKITLDNREELVVDLSTEMVEKDLQVEQLSNEIQELEELVGTRENTIEVLEDQLINTRQQLAEANQHLDMHHQEIQDMEAEGADEDVDIEGGEEPEPASSLDI